MRVPDPCASWLFHTAPDTRASVGEFRRRGALAAVAAAMRRRSASAVYPVKPIRILLFDKAVSHIAFDKKRISIHGGQKADCVKTMPSTRSCPAPRRIRSIPRARVAAHAQLGESSDRIHRKSRRPIRRRYRCHGHFARWRVALPFIRSSRGLAAICPSETVARQTPDRGKKPRLGSSHTAVFNGPKPVELDVRSWGNASAFRIGDAGSSVQPVSTPVISRSRGVPPKDVMFHLEEEENFLYAVHENSTVPQSITHGCPPNATDCSPMALRVRFVPRKATGPLRRPSGAALDRTFTFRPD